MTDGYLTGGCQCGAVRYRVPAQPIRASVCYCRMCQRASGGPLMAFVRYDAADVHWSSPPAVFEEAQASSSGVFLRAVRHAAQPTGGSRGQILGLTINSLDDPEAGRPDPAVFAGYAEVSWCRRDLAALPGKDFDVTGDAPVREPAMAGTREG